jgi:drug/metabolite transporter (DMT)-like permease
MKVAKHRTIQSIINEMTATTRAWFQIHFCVVLWGFTAILGKSITLPALPLVWLRMLVVTVVVMLIPGFWRGLTRMSPALIATYAGIGLLVTAHWLTFYSAIKLANASVAATCMALTPVFVAFMEPALMKRRFDVREVFFGVAVIPGVALVVGGTPAGMRPGIAVGVLSAFFGAAFSALNKRFIGKSSALAVTGVEIAVGAVCLAFVSPFVVPSGHDALLLLALAIGCTLIPFSLSLVALRHLSAFASVLALNMEPVYSIVLAIVFLGEQRELTVAFYAGVAIIMAVVFGHGRLFQTGSR